MRRVGVATNQLLSMQDPSGNIVTMAYETTNTPGVSERRSGASAFYHEDRLGSTTKITNASQTVTDTRQYDAFGMLVSSTGSNPTPFGFVAKGGYQQDSDSGLMLLGHRYYDPSIGRFLTRDPAKDGRNWYDYCANGPLRATDPSGLGIPEWLENFWTWVADKAEEAVHVVSWPIKIAAGLILGAVMYVAHWAHGLHQDAHQEDHFPIYIKAAPNENKTGDGVDNNAYIREVDPNAMKKALSSDDGPG